MQQGKYRRVEKPKREEPEPTSPKKEIKINAVGKMRGYISYATGLLQAYLDQQEGKQLAPPQEGAPVPVPSDEVVLKAMGRAINKTVTIAEIIKRKIPGLHQLTTIASTDLTDHYEPIEEGLEPFVQTRHVSSINIVLSLHPLDTTAPGYQPPLPPEARIQQSPRLSTPQQSPQHVPVSDVQQNQRARRPRAPRGNRGGGAPPSSDMQQQQFPQQQQHQQQQHPQQFSPQHFQQPFPQQHQQQQQFPQQQRPRRGRGNNRGNGAPPPQQQQQQFPPYYQQQPFPQQQHQQGSPQQFPQQQQQWFFPSPHQQQWPQQPQQQQQRRRTRGGRGRGPQQGQQQPQQGQQQPQHGQQQPQHGQQQPQHGQQHQQQQPRGRGPQQGGHPQQHQPQQNQQGSGRR